MKKNNRETGAKAEAIACWFLKQQGYDVLEQKGISGTSCRPKKTAEDPKECNDLFKEESSIF